MTQPKPLQEWSYGSAVVSTGSSEFPEFITPDLSNFNDNVIQTSVPEIQHGPRAQNFIGGFKVSTYGTGSRLGGVFVIDAGNDVHGSIAAGYKEVHGLTLASVGLSQGRAGSTTSSTAQSTLDILLQTDAARLWANGRVALEEDNLENAQRELDLFLKRHGESGVLALSRLLLGRTPSGQTAWTLLQMLGESLDAKTVKARRDLLAAALESRDAGLRYAAATALGQFGDFDATEALRKRLDWEKNISVRRMIEAELRR